MNINLENSPDPRIRRHMAKLMVEEALQDDKDFNHELIFSLAYMVLVMVVHGVL